MGNEIKNEKTQQEEKKYWFEKYTEFNYKGVMIRMYNDTPWIVQKAIENMIDKIKVEDHADVTVYTEASTHFFIDVFSKHKYITQNDIYSDDVIISRQKHKGKYMYRVRHVVNALRMVKK